MKHIYNLKFVFSFVAVLFISSSLFSQQVAVTEDGHEVYLKSDLEKMSVEKQDIIKNSGYSIVVDSKEELKNLRIAEYQDESLAPKEQQTKVSSDDRADNKSDLIQYKLELKEKIKNGELTNEEAKELYYKRSGNVQAEIKQKVKNGELTDEEAKNIYHQQIEQKRAERKEALAKEDEEYEVVSDPSTPEEKAKAEEEAFDRKAFDQRVKELRNQGLSREEIYLKLKEENLLKDNSNSSK